MIGIKKIYMGMVFALFLLKPGFSDSTGIVWTPDSTSDSLMQGRHVIRYDHPLLWGNEGGANLVSEYFYVALPARDTSALRPLIIYLHSAGGTGQSELAGAGLRFLETAGPDFMLLEPNCNTGYSASWWWGWTLIQTDTALYRQTETPVEKRVLATIEWVVQKYAIDLYKRGLTNVDLIIHDGEVHDQYKNVFLPDDEG
jgi:hypothetical protein